MQKGKRKPFPLPSCRLHRLAQKKLRTVSERQNVPNKPSGLTESGKALQSLFYALLRHSQHQPPGSLRVEYEGGPQAVHIGAHERTAGPMPAVGITARRNQAVRGERLHVVDKRQRGGVYLDDDPGTPRHLSSKCPPSPNPVISVAALRFMARSTSAAFAFKWVAQR